MQVVYPLESHDSPCFRVGAVQVPLVWGKQVRPLWQALVCELVPVLVQRSPWALPFVHLFL